MRNLYTKFSLGLITVFLSGAMVHAQTGPGGVGTTNGASNLKVWLRADRGVFTDGGTTAATNGQTVQQWNDQSGNNLHAIQTSNPLKPNYKTTFSNGLPSLGFTTNELAVAFNINPATTPEFTVFAVVSHNPAYYRSKIFGHDNGGYDRTIGFDSRATTNFTYFSGNYVERFANVPVSTPFLVTANYTPSTFSGWINGRQEVTNGVVSNGAGATTFSIGNIAVAAVVSEYWNGDIAEFILFDKTVSKAERLLVENYLAAKYGITLDVSSDFYTMDNSGYDFDVVGIGHADNNTEVTSAMGGMVSISNPSDFTANTNEFLFLGHNNANMTTITTGNPTGLVKRLGRTWAVSETGDVGTVTLSVDLTGEPVANPADLRLLIDTDNDGSFGDEVEGVGVIAGATQSGNVYTFNNVNLNNGNLFTVGSVTPETLPVTLTSFDVTNKGASNDLTWYTASEENTAYFDIERSTNGRNFTPIGKVMANGNSSSTKGYTYTDVYNAEGKVYYRLKMVDADKKFNYSKVVAVWKESVGQTLTFAPNPVINTVVIKGLKGAVSFIQIMNLEGKVITQQQTSKNTFELDMSAYPSGTYFLKVSSDQQVFTEKLIKK